MSSTTPLRCLSRRRPLPHAAQPAFEIQTTSLFPPFQTPEGLLLETTDVRKGKPDPPDPESPPHPEPRHSLPFAEPGKGQERSPRSRSSPAQEPGRCSTVSPPRAPQQRRRGGYPMPGRGASLRRWNRAGNQGKVWSRSGGLERRPGGSQVLSPGHPGLTGDPSIRRRHPSLPQTLLPLATTTQGGRGFCTSSGS